MTNSLTTIEELKQLDIKGKTVYVLGVPASGKSFVSNEIYHNNRSHHFIHTDSYISDDFRGALYSMIEDLHSITGNFIIEGVGVYRLLRKVYELKLDFLKPDIIIECCVSEWLQNETYRIERPGKIMKGVKSLNLSLTKILNDWEMSTPDSEKPTFINFLNDWK